MLILVDDPLLYDTADTSDSTDLLIMNYNVGQQSQLSWERQIECRSKVYVEKDIEW